MSATGARWLTCASRVATAWGLAFVLLCSTPWAQGRGGVASFPAQQRDPADPAIVAKGRAIYDTECRSCHGADLRGGERGGPNLLRSQVVLNDREGESILPVIQGSHKDRLSPAGVDRRRCEGARRLYSQRARACAGTGRAAAGAASRAEGARRRSPRRARNISLRSARSCHSVTGDLRGVGARDLGPAQLQNLWIAGGAGGGGRGAAPLAGKRPPPMTTRREAIVVVTLPSGTEVRRPARAHRRLSSWR